MCNPFTICVTHHPFQTKQNDHDDNGDVPDNDDDAERVGKPIKDICFCRNPFDVLFTQTYFFAMLEWLLVVVRAACRQTCACMIDALAHTKQMR